MTLRRRLLLAQAPLGLALVLLGAAALRTATTLGGSSEAILKDNYRSVLAAQRMEDALQELDRTALLHVAGRPPAAGAAEARQRFEDALGVQEGNVTEPGEAQATALLRAAWADYGAALARLAASGAGLAGYLDALQPASARVRGAAAAILDLNQDAMVRKSNEARRKAERHLHLMLAATLGALALGLLASVSLTARIVRPISALAEAVRRFGEGDLASRARPAGADEIAALGREFDTMADRLEEYRASSLGELLAAQQGAQAAIDSLPDPVLILGPERQVLNLNRTAESLLRLSPGEGAGASLHGLEPALRDRIAAVVSHVLAGKGPWVPRGFEEAVRSDGPDGPRHLLPRATALHSEEGAIIGATLVLQDVTRLMRFDELKNDLVATVAHEFRTPLTSLRMAVHLCAEEAAGPLTDRQADLMAAARQDCERLQTIVDDILDLSRIQAGRVDLSLQPLEARAVVEQAVAAARPAAAQAGLDLVVEGPDGPLAIVADADRLQLVLSNLLGNAVRHAPPGTAIAVRVAPEGGGSRFEVEDAGEGIPPQYRERIFERFFQVPGARRGGVGLGLYISREIVRAHGGDMGVESLPGRGCTFWFTLPPAAPADGAPVAVPPA